MSFQNDFRQLIVSLACPDELKTPLQVNRVNSLVKSSLDVYFNECNQIKERELMENAEDRVKNGLLGLMMETQLELNLDLFDYYEKDEKMLHLLLLLRKNLVKQKQGTIEREWNHSSLISRLPDIETVKTPSIDLSKPPDIVSDWITAKMSLMTGLPSLPTSPVTVQREQPGLADPFQEIDEILKSKPPKSPELNNTLIPVIQTLRDVEPLPDSLFPTILEPVYQGYTIPPPIGSLQNQPLEVAKQLSLLFIASLQPTDTPWFDYDSGWKPKIDSCLGIQKCIEIANMLTDISITLNHPENTMDSILFVTLQSWLQQLTHYIDDIITMVFAERNQHEDEPLPFVELITKLDQVDEVLIVIQDFLQNPTLDLVYQAARLHQFSQDGQFTPRRITSILLQVGLHRWTNWMYTFLTSNASTLLHSVDNGSLPLEEFCIGIEEDKWVAIHEKWFFFLPTDLLSRLVKARVVYDHMLRTENWISLKLDFGISEMEDPLQLESINPVDWVNHHVVQPLVKFSQQRIDDFLACTLQGSSLDGLQIVIQSIREAFTMSGPISSLLRSNIQAWLHKQEPWPKRLESLNESVQNVLTFPHFYPQFDLLDRIDQSQSVSTTTTPRKTNMTWTQGQEFLNELSRLKCTLIPRGDEGQQKARRHVVEMFYLPVLDDIFTTLLKISIASVAIDECIPWTRCPNVSCRLQVWKMRRFTQGLWTSLTTLIPELSTTKSFDDALIQHCHDVDKISRLLFLDTDAKPLHQLLLELLSLLVSTSKKNCISEQLCTDWSRAMELWKGILTRLSNRSKETTITSLEWNIYLTNTVE